MCHIARLPEDTPAHQALRWHVNLTLGHLPDQSWKRRPGRPNNRWIDQLRRDNSNTPPADLWRRSTTRGHSGVTLRSSTTTRWRRRRQWHVSQANQRHAHRRPPTQVLTQHAASGTRNRLITSPTP